jgi:crossover junction endodeoxyribonuclease RuvC
MIKDKVILGIDPGTNVMGFGLIHIRGNQVKLIEMGVLNMSKIDDHGMKLKMIFDHVTGLIDKHHPDEVAAEAPFFGKNVQSMLKLGRAQGVALAAALNRNLPIFEYAPRSIKQSITGKGAASKEQVAAMLQSILKIQDADMPKAMDATDGLAAALCHYFQKAPKVMSTKSKSTGGSWAAFVKNNPDRLKS